MLNISTCPPFYSDTVFNNVFRLLTRANRECSAWISIIYHLQWLFHWSCSGDIFTSDRSPHASKPPVYIRLGLISTLRFDEDLQNAPLKNLSVNNGLWETGVQTTHRVCPPNWGTRRLHCFEIRCWFIMMYSSAEKQTTRGSRRYTGLQRVFHATGNDWEKKQCGEDAIIRYEGKACNLKRPPGHPVIHVSECCVSSPGSQLQNWVYQPIAKWLAEQKPQTLPVFLLGLTRKGFSTKWIIHLLHLIWKAAVMRHFCTVFPHSGLSRATSTVWLSLKLLMDCGKLA